MTLLAPSNEWPVWVEYFDPEDSHGHLLLIKAPDEHITMQQLLAEMEGFAGELAEMFHLCGNQSHGKGIKHSTEVAKKAFEAAITQLLITDYQEEWAEIKRKQRVFYKWGGQVPAMILQPKSNSKEWEVIMPDKEGNPWVYGARKNVLEDMMDPRELNAKPVDDGLGGWMIPEEK